MTVTEGGRHALRRRLPWWSKLTAKLLLARLPVSYRTWARMRLFRHGSMDDPAHAFDVVTKHLRAYHERIGRWPTVVLEIGPGDSLVSSLIGRAFGVERTILVDAGSFARDDLADWRAAAAYLHSRGVGDGARLERMMIDTSSLGRALEQVNAVYLTDGVSALRSLADASVDLVWTNAVLEHVPREEFRRLNEEVARVLKPEGLASHEVDLADHLGGRLDNLRFPAPVWESRLFRGSGFYTNRLRLSEIMAVFDDAGLRVVDLQEQRWAALPTPRAALAKQFRHLPDRDLLTERFDVVLSRAETGR